MNYIRFGVRYSSKVTKLITLKAPYHYSLDLHRFQTNMTSKYYTGLPLSDVVSKLNEYAPLALAESWDNVGLLVEPSTERNINKMILTIDLTEDVLNEAITTGSSLILSYHPPIFKPLKRLSKSTWKERIIVKAIEHRIAIYSPHTAFDSVFGGVNDWLLLAYPTNGQLDVLKPIEQSKVTSNSGSLKITCRYEEFKKKESLKEVSELAERYIGDFMLESTQIPENSSICFYCKPDVHLASLIQDLHSSKLLSLVEMTQLSKLPLLDAGVGRLMELPEPLSIGEVIELTKEHLQLSQMRVAMGNAKKTDMVSTIAVCAGSGISVLNNVNADVYLTGEMSHHEILDAVSRNKVVLLGEHSNTERGYLDHIKSLLEMQLSHQVEIIVSKTDHDPIEIQ